MFKSVFTRTDKFPGWWVVSACFTLLTFSSGLGFYGLAVYLQAFSRELGWSVSSISLATTLFFLVGGVSGISIAKFIAKKGQGLHHIAFEVDDIYAEMKRLEQAGFTLLQEEPKKGADNKLICFLHPRSTEGVLIEICQEIR